MPVKPVDRMNTDAAAEPKPTVVFRGSGKTIKPVDVLNQEACRHRFRPEAVAGYVPYAHARWCQDCKRWVW
jgi:hypothetical protein